MRNQMKVLLLMILGVLVNACSAPFEPDPYTNPSTKSSGIPSAGESGNSQESTDAGLAGLSGRGGDSGGDGSNGGDAATDSAGTGGAMASSASCLANYSTDHCGDACTGSAYPGCKEVLNCLIEKNVPPPQGPLDPCYPTEYTSLTIATRV